MPNDYRLLAVKESIWAEMLLDVLKDNNIPCTALPVHGAGMVLKGGVVEELKIYVPANWFARAEELVAMGLNIPQITRVFLELRKLGLDVEPVYTLQQAIDTLTALKGGST